MTTLPTSLIATGDIRPEDEVVLRCARACVQSDPDHRISELVAQVTDWDYLLRVASRHGLTSLVAHALDQQQPADLPIAVASALRTASRDRGTRTLQLTGVLIQLLDLFAANAIPALPFKGPVLGTILYGHVGLRSSVDLDILIRRQDILRATDLMVERGFHTDLPTDEAQQAAYLHVRHELHFRPADGACLIELHQAFLPPFYSFAIDYDALWARTERKAFCGRDILTLRHSDLLLALCAHATKHSWERLAWICDISGLLHVLREELDWNEITSEAAAVGATRMLLLGLSLAHDLLGAQVPADVLEHAQQDRRVHRLANTVASGLFAETAGGELRSHRSGSHSYVLPRRTRPHLHHRHRSLPAESKPRPSSQVGYRTNGSALPTRGRIPAESSLQPPPFKEHPQTLGFPVWLTPVPESLLGSLASHSGRATRPLFFVARDQSRCVSARNSDIYGIGAA